MGPIRSLHLMLLNMGTRHFSHEVKDSESSGPYYTWSGSRPGPGPEDKPGRRDMAL